MVLWRSKEKDCLRNVLLDSQLFGKFLRDATEQSLLTKLLMVAKESRTDLMEATKIALR